MARVKYGEMIADIRGKINGTVHTKGRYGSVMRNKVTPVNPASVSQSVQKSEFASLAQSWRGLTQVQRDAWNVSVDDFKRTNIFGDSIRPSGINLFVQLNRIRLGMSLAQLNDPPVPTSVEGLTDLSLADAAAAGVWDLTFAPTVPAATQMIVEATRGMSQGRQFARAEFRIIDRAAAATTSPFDINDAYEAVFGSVPGTGFKVFVRARFADETSGLTGVSRSASVIMA